MAAWVSPSDFIVVVRVRSPDLFATVFLPVRFSVMLFLPPECHSFLSRPEVATSPVGAVWPRPVGDPLASCQLSKEMSSSFRSSRAPYSEYIWIWSAPGLLDDGGDDDDDSQHMLSALF